MVLAMSNESADPSGSTEQFRAYAGAPDEPASRSATPLIIAIVVAVLVVAAVAWLAMS
jgi:hypothetical protein